MRPWIAIAAACFAGCGPTATPIVLPVLDSAVFATEVEPILEQRCANPTCHGNERRRLRVYAPGRFRRDAARLHLDEALDADELAANDASARAFAAGIVRAFDSLLISKPLEWVTHLGGPVFVSAEDRECQSILRWLRTGGLP